MNDRFRRRALAAALGLSAALVTSTGVAAAAPAQSADADITGGGFHVVFSADRPADQAPDAATGTFSGAIEFGKFKPGSVTGPVTCLDVRGNTVGLFYPVEASDPFLFGVLVHGVFLSLTLNAQGQPSSFSFTPTPFGSTRTCAPGFTYIPAKGTATLTGGTASAKSRKSHKAHKTRHR